MLSDLKNIFERLGKILSVANVTDGNVQICIRIERRKIYVTGVLSCQPGLTPITRKKRYTLKSGVKGWQPFTPAQTLLF